MIKEGFEAVDLNYNTEVTWVTPDLKKMITSDVFKEEDDPLLYFKIQNLQSQKVSPTLKDFQDIEELERRRERPKFKCRLLLKG